MKKIALVFIIIFCFLTNKPAVVAQTPTLVPTSVPASQLDTLLQGTDCGGLNQQCCDVSNVDIPTANITFSPPFDILNYPLNALSDIVSNRLVEPMVNTIRNLFYNTFEINPQSICKDTTKPSNTSDPASCVCISEAEENASRLCLSISGSEQGECLSCVTGQKGIWTAIGCVQSDLGAFISQKLLGWGVGLAGMIALLCIIYSAFQLQTSRGNPEKIKKAQELLTSCIMGLMLIIFSIFILKFIGMDILRIPGFS